MSEESRRPAKGWLAGRATVRVVGAIGLVLAGSLACTSGSGQTQVSSTGTEPTLLVHDVRGGGQDAEVNGYLHYLDEADCLVLEPEPEFEPLIRHVVVWPPGTEIWQGDGQVVGVEVPDAGAILLGDWISGGGGYANPETSDIDLPEVAPECLTGGGEFALLERVSEVRSGR